ncbi:unnamed protein product, partial [Leptidea sinapis]
ASASKSLIVGTSSVGGAAAAMGAINKHELTEEAPYPAAIGTRLISVFVHNPINKTYRHIEEGKSTVTADHMTDGMTTLFRLRARTGYARAMMGKDGRKRSEYINMGILVLLEPLLTCPLRNVGARLMTELANPGRSLRGRPSYWDKPGRMAALNQCSYIDEGAALERAPRMSRAGRLAMSF